MAIEGFAKYNNNNLISFYRLILVSFASQSIHTNAYQYTQWKWSICIVVKRKTKYHHICTQLLMVLIKLCWEVNKNSYKIKVNQIHVNHLRSRKSINVDYVSFFKKILKKNNSYSTLNVNSEVNLVLVKLKTLKRSFNI